jgi:signal peptidase II
LTLRAEYPSGTEAKHTRAGSVTVKTRFVILGATVPTILILDIVTKRWAMEALNARSMEIFGGLVPLTLAYNRGAAFGISIGHDPRWFFIPVTAIALVLLTYLLVKTDSQDRFRLVALALVFSGALGNLFDRIRWDRGVVDFIGPINLGFMDWPIFNVADMAISCGAVALAISFWMEEDPAAEVPVEGALEKESQAAS